MMTQNADKKPAKSLRPDTIQINLAIVYCSLLSLSKTDE